MARLWDLVHPWLPFNFWAVTERRKGNTGIKYLAEQHSRMALVGLRNKNVSISSPTRLPWGIPHRRRGRLIKNQREKSVILQLKLTQAKLESFTCTPKQDNERPRPIHIGAPLLPWGFFTDVILNQYWRGLHSWKESSFFEVENFFKLSKVRWT